MKILFVCQHYKPEPFRLSDICEDLVRKGHEVSVLAGIPNYPEGKIYADYRHNKKRREIIEGVTIYRSYTIPRKKSVVFRLLNYFSFAISSTLGVLLGRYKTKDGSNFDCVFVNQLSPVMMVWAGMAYKKKYKKPMFLYCMDVWPDSLTVGGVKQDGLIFKLFKFISKKVYRASDYIFVTSPSFKNYFVKQFDISEQKITYLPQYAEDLFIPDESIVNKESVDLTFAGNIGKAQNLETILKAASLIEKNTNLPKKIHFHFVGDGTELLSMKALAHELELKNISFYGRRSLEEMPSFYKKSDAMLVSLIGDSIVSRTIPGKVQSYMAAGKPIIGAISGDAKIIVEEANCGYVSPERDVKQLAKNICKFSMLSIKRQRELGKKARCYYENHFSKEQFMLELETCLERESKKE
ncbi:capsular polysaccharide biosynthesis protein Cps4F [Streptococcus pneumoniae]|uniref:capsular polysaccharide biosynthesis protein Cps4F n=1 Tax=Streptococcus pneumoniae TaxID=1313 RepID=UPI0005DF6EE3|nr:capsular polysaccharide biosynthesis protein Cps4F [Streptococcus pneumoniae]COC63611.1 capsular polysaccharide biosynthesis protein Cps4F [Streptococcus pneumoniae]